MPESIERLRATVEHLAAIERPSASDGEKRAAEWILERLNGSSADARIEEERAHGTYWVPLGLMTAAAGLAGLAAARGGRGARALALGIGAAAAAGVADDVSGGPHVFRRAAPAAGPPTTSSPRRATATRGARSCSSPTTTPRTAGWCSRPS